MGSVGCVVCGCKGSIRVKVLRHDGPEHVMAFAPTRSGKGVSLVVPTLLSWTEICLVLDIKGENYALTAGWRTQIGQRSLRLEPAALNGAACHNPMHEVRHGRAFQIHNGQKNAHTKHQPIQKSQ